MNSLNRIALMIVVVMLAPSSISAAAGDAARSLNFNVFLDDSKIGFHRFDIDAGTAGNRIVHSEARFDVKFLLFTAFRYRHENSERWDDGCLVAIDAETDSNGKQTEVSGERTDSGFAVSTAGEVRTLPTCVMTFAYWNPDFLAEDKLLNPQTGEYLDVDVTQRPEEQVVVGGREVTAVPYEIRAKGMEITVWYSPDNEWLALESLAKGDRVIRYELS